MAERPQGKSVQTVQNQPPVRRPRVIARSRETYLTQQGWHLSFDKQGEAQFAGWYRTRYGSFAGFIRDLFSPKRCFYIHHPPEELRSHPHWLCFTPRPDKGDGWYSVHFSVIPKDLDSAVLHIEGVLNESFGIARDSAYRERVEADFFLT